MNMNSTTVDTLLDMLSVRRSRRSSSRTPSFSHSQLTPPANMNPPSNGYAGRALEIPSSRFSQNSQYSSVMMNHMTSPSGTSYHQWTSSDTGSMPLNAPAR